MVTQPTPVTDKNGKHTTVHKKVDAAPKTTRKLPQPASAEAVEPTDAVVSNHEFNENDYARIISAFEEINKFKGFVLDRFKVFAEVHEDFKVDEVVTRGGGYVTFEVDDDSLFNDRAQEILIRKETVGERYDDGMTTTYRLPKVFLFQSSEQEADYAKFLALKKSIFGGRGY